MSRVIIGVIFTVSYAWLALNLGALLSVHGPDLILPFSLGFLVVVIAALWGIYFFVEGRAFQRKTLTFSLSASGIGLLLLGTIIASREPVYDWEIRQQKRREANTEVLNMRDEVWLSPQGNPIGIRLRYSMRFPDSSYFAHSPFVTPEKYLGVGISSGMRIANRTIEPPMIGTDPLRYEKGELYDFTVDMLPAFLVSSRDKAGQCITLPPEDRDAFQELMQSTERVHFIISVWGTRFREPTTNAYSLKEFYDSAVKEGTSECYPPWGGAPPRPPARPAP